MYLLYWCIPENSGIQKYTNKVNQLNYIFFYGRIIVISFDRFLKQLKKTASSVRHAFDPSSLLYWPYIEVFWACYLAKPRKSIIHISLDKPVANKSPFFQVGWPAIWWTCKRRESIRSVGLQASSATFQEKIRVVF